MEGILLGIMGFCVAAGSYLLLSPTRHLSGAVMSTYMRRIGVRWCSDRRLQACGLWLMRFRRIAYVASGVCRVPCLSQFSLDPPIAAVMCLCMVCGGACVGCVVLPSFLGMGIGALCSCFLLDVWARYSERLHAKSLVNDLPGALRSLAGALESGHTLTQALSYVGDHNRNQIGEEFRCAALRLCCGESLVSSLAPMERYGDIPGAELFIVSILVSQRTGAPLGDLLARSAGLIEECSALESLLFTKTAQVRLSVRVVSCMPWIMLVLLSLLSPDFREGLASLPGMVCVGIAFLLNLCALALIRRLMRKVM